MKIYKQQYIVDYSDVDRDYCMKLPCLLQIFGTVATKHQYMEGISPMYLEKFDMAWVLYEYSVQIQGDLNMYAKQINIESFVEPVLGMYAVRYYGIYDQEYNLIGKATSKWVVIDTKKRKLAKLPQEIKEKMSLSIEDLNESQKSIYEMPKNNIKSMNLIDKKDEQTKVHSHIFDIKYFDVDANRHINNTIYPTWAIDTVYYNEEDFIQERKVCSSKIIYKKELLDTQKQVLSFYVKIDENTTHHEIYSTQKELLTIIELTWKKVGKN